MLGVILKILSVLGILLLVLLGIVLVLLLIVLFCPITYKAEGEKNSEAKRLTVKVNWLFGLLRIRYAYPEPGKLIVKLFWHKLYESGTEREDELPPAAENQPTSDTTTQETPVSAPTKETAKVSPQETNTTETIENPNEIASQEQTNTETDAQVQNDGESLSDTSEVPESEEDGFFAKKIAKIKYTFSHIYDKIKGIWENITYYTNLLREEETKQLFSHVCLRIGKIIKHIRPRHLKAEVLFGTGSPDTTGYLFGFYGMLSPSLGRGVTVIPDFTQPILEGNFYVSGHITVVVLLVHALRVLFDKKLWKFIKKLKAGRK